MTALVLQAYAIGLAGYAAIRLLTPCFYALNLPRTPMRIVLIGIGVNLALNFLNMTVFHLGIGRPGAGGLLRLPRQRLAAGLLALAAGGLRRHGRVGRLPGARADGLGALRRGGVRAMVADGHHVHGFVLRALGLFVAIGGAVAVYAGAGYALRIGETHEAVAMFQRRC